ncbi:MAG: hypothetical protein Q8916_00315 [Bacteroidota bacterium]|nr:hypothetical protein [Bacteroidota bacterium]MDP4228830.1 hypothetical protein [Bacteroidota bacterium]
MTKVNKKFITISWKAGREPVDDMFWCEAEYDGSWTNITTMDRLRSRREVVERIVNLDQAFIGFDFAFSFPKPFMAFLTNEGIGNDWRTIARKIREDLKKNTDDGVRLWIERIGKYRESHLESLDDANSYPRRDTASRGNGRRNFGRETPAPYERRSLAERFRRIDMILKRKDTQALASTLGIKYNRLTARYEFAESESRGRATLLGISMLEQLLEAKPEIAIWPFMKPASITAIEIFPKMFVRKVGSDPESPKAFFDMEEDNALFVSREIRELVYANPSAHDTVFALLGIIKAERREDKSLRPLRDYRDYFYSNEEVQAEGWAYGIGFKEPEKKHESKPSEHDNLVSTPVPDEAVTISAEVAANVSVEENTNS